MVPCPKINSTTMEHFTHPAHPLLEHNAATEYICDGCKTLGTGTRFRCNMCDFDLHEYCGKCPTSLSSFMHPLHYLSLVVLKPQGMRTNDRICNVCGDSIEGLFYRCKDCEFDVHPLCTQLPQYLCHALHPSHYLTLQAPKTASWCVVCRGICNSWRYKCGDCGRFDIHLECVLVSCHATTQQVPIFPQLAPPPPLHRPPPFYGGYDSGGVAYGSNPYYNMYNTGAYANYQAPYNMENSYANQAQVGAPSNGTPSPSKKIFSLVGKLASNVIFGMGNVDFSAFM